MAYDVYNHLMLHFNDETQFDDDSLYEHTITAYGGAAINTSIKKFGSGSVYFDGSDDYLSIPDGNSFNFNKGDFTIDFWIRFTSDEDSIVCGQFVDQSHKWGIYLSVNSNYAGFYLYGTWIINTYSAGLSAIDTWYHIALVRDGSNITLYRDGISICSSSSFTSSIDVAATFQIGRTEDSPGHAYLHGYIDEFRVSKSIARWTSAFTPPTSEYPSVDNINYTNLLLHLNDNIADDSGYNHAVTEFGGATGNTSIKKFGSGSERFDGIDGYLKVTPDSSFNLDTADFTIDFWVNFNDLNKYVYLLDLANVSTNSYINIYRYPADNRKLVCDLYLDGAIYDDVRITADPFISIGVWYHVAIVRHEENILLFVDGQLLAEKNVGIFHMSQCTPYIGAPDPLWTGGAFFDGYIDELKIVQGIATWTANFTPPTAEYLGSNTKTIDSNTSIESTVTKTILSNSNISLATYSKLILSNTNILLITFQKTILSDARILFSTFVDSVNKINTVLQNLSNITNKCTFVMRRLYDNYNIISFVGASISDIRNNIVTQKRNFYNLINDIRFLKSWQVPNLIGVQSLGKTYITVSINSIIQTDVDVDSVVINKMKGQAFTASFELGRAYDATKPDLELPVVIKYDEWTLFRGYISAISPTDSPESIRIECQNKHWLDNRTNVYFQVGHKPTDDKEKYYETIYDAISTEYSLYTYFGNFVPETINCFSKGKADVLTDLCEQSGNYNWFYDESESKVIWEAGAGSIIELQKQSLGTNLNLYHVLEHRFFESAEDIVNKLRVQMGAKIADQKNSSRTYTGYSYEHFSGFAYPAWNSVYELLRSRNYTGYGWDYPEPGQEDNYKDVFKKYSLFNLNPDLSTWADDKPTLVKVESSGWFFPVNIPETDLTEGFTIDYENGYLIFNEPKYCIQKNDKGETIAVRAPVITVDLWKKNQWTVTLTDGDNPEVDIGNPLMFITSKIGSYPTEIIKDYQLSNLTIQDGGVINGVVVPGWDDTEFATDLAYWQLSKSSEKRINGNIKITLDAVCFYNIDLSKRIYIDNITESPMNIAAMSYNLSTFTVDVELENPVGYTRTVSLSSRGE
jgi:hypothetical protein